MAPEVHSNRKATRASDVFSLHVVMWEVRKASTFSAFGFSILCPPHCCGDPAVCKA